ncbi:MAG TPA: hypothetical protein VGN32_21140 [Ktedonobacterales bacterium]|jgi:hypothetical protein|nr:hypothetical protein [Ktedonobacterales bacterium]
MAHNILAAWAHPALDHGPVTMLSLGDALDGLDVLPGFSFALADLFA